MSWAQKRILLPNGSQKDLETVGANSEPSGMYREGPACVRHRRNCEAWESAVSPKRCNHASVSCETTLYIIYP